MNLAQKPGMKPPAQQIQQPEWVCTRDQQQGKSHFTSAFQQL